MKDKIIGERVRELRRGQSVRWTSHQEGLWEQCWRDQGGTQSRKERNCPWAGWAMDALDEERPGGLAGGPMV